MISNYYIGGDFEFDLKKNSKLKKINNFNKFKHNFYSNSRTSFNTILKNTNKGVPKTILIPDYLCGETLIDVIIKNRWKFKVYKVDKNYEIPTKQFKNTDFKKFGAILVINYFGLSDNISFIENIKNKNNIVTIYDCVQNPWYLINLKKGSFDVKLPEFVDYAFTSFKKTFPVPNGSILISKKKFKVEPNTLKKNIDKNWVIAAKKKYDFINNNNKKDEKDEKEYLALFKKNKIQNKKIGGNISNLTIKILNKINLNNYANIRLINYNYLVEKNDKNKKFITNKNVPMFYS